jgi:hypothetical protein
VATPVDGESITIAPNEEVVLDGTTKPRISAYAAPPPDVWDQWNDDRTRDLIDAVSARYVSPELYGTDDLDRHGTWRVMPTYGTVWIPSGIPPGWAPYSDGTWILDPYYGWTWVDRAPWGWAPYHYGRWVHTHGYWAWAPGPLMRRPVYAPALVAFMGGPGLQVGVSFGSRPSVGWVALGWGEPCVPWWGRPGFIHRPWWGGWGGPRVVNDMVIHHHQVVHVQHIHHYHHVKHGRGVMAVHREDFGRGPMRPMHVARVDSKHLKLHEAVSRSHATPGSFAPFDKKGRRPPQENINRPVVATRRPHGAKSEQHTIKSPSDRQARNSAPFRLVAPPRKGREMAVPNRPSLGQGEHERPSRQHLTRSPPAMERHSVRREPEIRQPSARPEASPSSDRLNVKGRLPGELWQRQPGSEPRTHPAPGLPGRPANALSPQSRERLRQHQQPRTAPERPVQNAPAISGNGRERVRQLPSPQSLPRISPHHSAPGAAGSQGYPSQRIMRPREGQGLQMDRPTRREGFQQNDRPGRPHREVR